MNFFLLTVLQYLLLINIAGARTSSDWRPWTFDHTPDYVLVATAENVTINCLSRYSVIFNGSLPGPPLYLKENQTTWVRVYNNIEDQNLTVVCQAKISTNWARLIRTALARSKPKNGHLLGWDTTSLAVPDRTS